jgi:hypothetical protein
MKIYKKILPLLYILLPIASLWFLLPASLSLITDQKGPIVHYIFGMNKDFGGKPFSFIHYLSIKVFENMFFKKI